MLTAVLPLVAFALSPGEGTSSTTVMSPRAAQARLAEALADADSIDWVYASGHAVTFAIGHGGESYRVIAETRGKEVVAVSIRDAGRGGGRGGRLGWLIAEMQDTTAVTEASVKDGQVTITTSDGHRYLLLPGHNTNAGVEARWAAEWNSA
jgi:hypothetical protein